jgi:NADH-quinone oxidoreductase subunit M
LGVFWMGIYPESFIRPFRADVTRIVERLDRAAPAGDSHLKAGKPAVAPAEHGAEAAH